MLSVLVRTLPYMEKRFEIRCSEGDLAAWKAAAGRVPLAVWIRDALNAAAKGPSEVVAGEYAEFVPGPSSVVIDEAGVVQRVVVPDTRRLVGERPFKPDFRPAPKKR
jgi:hypothetical protein